MKNYSFLSTLRFFSRLINHQKRDLLLENKRFSLLTPLSYHRYLAKLENLSNITIPPAYSYTKTKDAMKSACENLSEKTMLQALWKYKMDFAMLGYDPFPCLLAKHAV